VPTLNRGKYYFGSFTDELIACAVFDDGNHQFPRIGEFMASARNPMINARQFQMSQLLSYCCRQLREHYDLLLTYCETNRTGIVYQGSSWHYAGINKALNMPNGYHEYWKPLNRGGRLLACEIGLTIQKYP